LDASGIGGADFQMKLWLIAAAAVTVPGTPPLGPHMHYEIRINKIVPAKPTNIVIAVDKSGTITLDGTKVTCEQMSAFFEKMAKDSHGKIKPLSCHQYPFVAPKKSN
jgi:hypothetical protein